MIFLKLSTLTLLHQQTKNATKQQIVPDEFEIKAKVEEILTESTHSDSRAAKMSIDDILQ